MSISEMIAEILYVIVKGCFAVIGFYFEQVEKHPIITIGLTILIIRNWL